MKRSKQQPRQQEERLCFYCNQLGHLKRNCPEIPYCSKCRTRGHTPDRCTDHSEMGTHVKPESPEINGEGIKIFHNFQVITTSVFIVQEIIRPQIVQQHGNSKPQPLTVLLVVQVPQYTKTHLTHHILPSHSNSQSPASHQHSQSSIHVQTPTLNINAPQFQSNLHQAPPPPLAQNNQSTSYHTNQQQMHTPPTQPFNAQLPQSFNPHVPPPYFPQYPPTNSPSAHSRSRLSRRSPGLMASTPVIVLTG